MSKSLINLLLLVTVGLLGLLIWLTTTSDDQNSPQPQNIVSNEHTDVITRVEITNKGGKFTRLEQINGKWFMTQPIRIEANAFLATKASNLLHSTYTKSFIPDANSLSNYGLSPASITLHLNNHHVIFGDASNVSKRRYILFQKTVYLIDDILLPILNSAPASFISHSLIPTDSRMTRLELPNLLLQESQGKWAMTPSNPHKEQVSQDIFIKFIDEWRLAQALYITLSKTENNATKIRNNNNMKETSVLISTADKRSYTFLISRKDSALILTRPDVGIHYHMHNDADQNLFSLPQPDV